MRTLILGGTGLISTAITAQLLARGDEVTHLTRGHTPAGGRCPYRPRRSWRPRRAARRLGRRPRRGGGHALLRRRRRGRGGTGFARTACGTSCAAPWTCTRNRPPTCPSTRSTSARRSPASGTPTARHSPRRSCSARMPPARSTWSRCGRRRPTWTRRSRRSDRSISALERLRAGAPMIMHGDGTGSWAACHRDDVAARVRRRHDRHGRLRSRVPRHRRRAADLASVLDRGRPTRSACGRGSYTFRPTCSSPRRPVRGVVLLQLPVRQRLRQQRRGTRSGLRLPTRWADGIAAGLASRTPRPVDPAERDTYAAVLDAWHRACRGMSSELSGKDLVQ